MPSFTPILGYGWEQIMDCIVLTRHRIENYCLQKKITSREMEIVHLIIEGKSNKEIEEILYISLSTVRNHITNIFTKLKVNSRMKLIKQFEQFRQVNGTYPNSK